MLTKAEEDGESRFWVCNPPVESSPDLTNWVGLVDEESGGFIAYFQDEELANRIGALLELASSKVVR